MKPAVFGKYTCSCELKLFGARLTDLSRRTTGPVLSASVTSWPGGRVPPARRGAAVRVWVTMIVVVVVVQRSGSVPVVSVARCRVGPRTSAFERRRVASSRRRPATVHLLPQRPCGFPRSRSSGLQRLFTAEQKAAGLHSVLEFILEAFLKT